MSVIFLTIDLFYSHDKGHMPVKKAMFWSLVWFALAFVFALWYWWYFDGHRALVYITCFLVEKSLSLDNLLVFILIFTPLNLKSEQQERALKIGILGALVLRFLMIFAGLELIQRFAWLHYVLGLILLITGIKILIKKEEKPFTQTLMWRLTHKIIPTTTSLQKNKLIIKEDGVKKCTPLLLSIILILMADILFAVDSVPAIFSLTNNLSTIYLANFFSILGLRPLFYLLQSGLDRFTYLQFGLGLILSIMGIKMLINIPVPVLLSLSLTIGIIGGSILISWVKVK